MDIGTRLILIPGLATDARVMAPQHAAFPHAEIPAWIEPRARESLAGYAQRLAAAIGGPGPMVIAGLSMGGMLALEMARHLPVRRVILIASCRDPRAVWRLLRSAELASRPWPTPALRALTPLAPLVVGRGGSVPPEGRRLLVRMAREIPMEFIRWSARAVLDWPGAQDVPVPVSHIHGDRDWVIPLRRVSPDRVVRGGSHVLNLSHPVEVNAFIRAHL